MRVAFFGERRRHEPDESRASESRHQSHERPPRQLIVCRTTKCEVASVTYLYFLFTYLHTWSQDIVLHTAVPFHAARVPPLRVRTVTKRDRAREVREARGTGAPAPIRVYMGTWGTRIAVASTPVHRLGARRWGPRAPRVIWRSTCQRVGLALIICNISVSASRRTGTPIRRCTRVREPSSWSVLSKLLRVGIPRKLAWEDFNSYGV